MSSVWFANYHDLHNTMYESKRIFVLLFQEEEEKEKKKLF